MGLEKERFVKEDVDDFICGICRNVLDLESKLDPCGHVFCKDCILKQVFNKQECPLSKNVLKQEMLIEMPHIIRSLLKKMKVFCKYKRNGCDAVVNYDELSTHEEECKLIHGLCKVEYGCQSICKQIHENIFGCVENLKEIINGNDNKVKQLEQIIKQKDEELNRLKLENVWLKKHNETTRSYENNINKNQNIRGRFDQISPEIFIKNNIWTCSTCLQGNNHEVTKCQNCDNPKSVALNNEQKPTLDSAIQSITVKKANFLGRSRGPPVCRKREFSSISRDENNNISNNLNNNVEYSVGQVGSLNDALDQCHIGESKISTNFNNICTSPLSNRNPLSPIIVSAKTINDAKYEATRKAFSLRNETNKSEISKEYLKEIELNEDKKDENELVIFRAECTLYFFDLNSRKWRQKGVGEIKILKNNTHNASRIFMECDKLNKILANHKINCDINMELASDNQIRWAALDISNNKREYEMFTAVFQTNNTAKQFKQQIELLQKNIQKSKQNNKESNEPKGFIDFHDGQFILKSLKFSELPKINSHTCPTCLKQIDEINNKLCCEKTDLQSIDTELTSNLASVLSACEKEDRKSNDDEHINLRLSNKIPASALNNKTDKKPAINGHRETNTLPKTDSNTNKEKAETIANIPNSSSGESTE